MHNLRGQKKEREEDGKVDFKAKHRTGGCLGVFEAARFNFMGARNI